MGRKEGVLEVEGSGVAGRDDDSARSGEVGVGSTVGEGGGGDPTLYQRHGKMESDETKRRDPSFIG